MASSLRSQFTNAPNLVTMGRVLLVPVVLLFIDNFSPMRSFIALLLYLLAAGGDFVDGYLARTRGQVSMLGKFLDPLADKLIVTAILVFMVQQGRVPAWLVVVLIARDLTINGLRGIAAAEGLVIAASDGGKIKTALQLVAIGMLLIHFRYPMLGLPRVSVDYHQVGLYILLLSAAVSIWSAAEYIMVFARTVSGAARAQSDA
jgi:CDP-diacylglycerol--glycerol-3-phosphate 3-phosphatidyltransferase